jgi:CRISPR/Cas system-associated exonuclease Cas4 (RecB family)
MSNKPRHRLSKSKIAAFEHCPRRLWLQIHRRHEALFSSDTLALFQFGHDVGARATFLIPDGVMVEARPDIQAALDRTKELLAEKKPRPIFEATFQHDNVLVRVDILEPIADGEWRAIEVKASVRVKAYQLADIATQVWVMRGCGVQIGEAIIRHLSPTFSWYRTDISSVQFADTDVSRLIERHLRNRPQVAHAASQAIEGPEVHRATGSHCERPFSCEFRGYCHRAEAMPLLALVHTGTEG